MTINRRHFLASTGAAGLASLLPRASSGAVHAAGLMGDHLTPLNAVTHRAVKSGSWQDAATWDCGVPGAGARVWTNGFTVTNHGETADIAWLRIDGAYETCPHCPTKLSVHTILNAGRFAIGSVFDPCSAEAVVEFLDGPFDPLDWQQLGRGLLSHGQVSVCGAEKTAWGVLNGEAGVGAVSIKLNQVPFGWKVGDEILIAGTDTTTWLNQVYQSERVTISAVRGRTIEFDSPLRHRHFPWEPGLDIHVANLTRNITFRSRSPQSIPTRGHLMYMHHANDIRFASMVGLGRTDKSQPVTDPRLDPVTGIMVPGSDANPRARYSDHNHVAGILNPPSRRQGVVVDGSPGWGLVNHRSNCQWDDCIATGCFGAGFSTEEGHERGHMRRCLALLNRGMGDSGLSDDDNHGRPTIGDWGTDGSGFWLQGGLVDVADCVSIDNSGRGFALFNQPLNAYPVYGSDQPVEPHLRFKISVPGSLLGEEYGGVADVASGAVPQRVFENNVAYGNKIGLQAWSSQTHDASGNRLWPETVRGSIDGLTLWGRGGRMSLEYARQMNVSGLRIVGDQEFREGWDSRVKYSSGVLLRGPEITVTDWEFSGLFGADYYVEGANDPGGIAGKNLVIEGATVNADGTVTAN